MIQLKRFIHCFALTSLAIATACSNGGTDPVTNSASAGSSSDVGGAYATSRTAQGGNSGGGGSSGSANATGSKLSNGGTVASSPNSSGSSGINDGPTSAKGGTSSGVTSANSGITSNGGSTAASAAVTTGGRTVTTSSRTTGGVASTASGGTGASSTTRASGGATAAAGRGSTTTTGAVTVAGNAGKGLTLYYIRHAEVVANTVPAEEITMENADTFTALGEQQITELTTYLTKTLNVTPDAVLVSPTKRTQKTIEPYLVAKNLTGVIWIELAECCTQTPSGGAIPTEPKLAPYKATIEGQNLVFRDPAATKYWQNDTYEAGLLMVSRAQNDILSQFSQSGKTIFVVGHASAGMVLLNTLRGIDVSTGSGSTNPNSVFLMNTGVQRAVQDPVTSAFKVDGKNINKPRTE